MTYGKAKTCQLIGKARSARHAAPGLEGVFLPLSSLVSQVLRWNRASTSQMALNVLTSFACRED